jgi:Family of unknown function (DUF5872)
MSSKVERSDPQLWERVKRDLTRSDMGGKPDQWSARKAQLAVQEYKRRGGGYRGRKPKDSSLEQWTEEEWGTKSGRNSLESGERYLPKRARAELSDEEYRATSATKRRDLRLGSSIRASRSGLPKRRPGVARVGPATSDAGPRPSPICTKKPSAATCPAAPG